MEQNESALSYSTDTPLSDSKDDAFGRQAFAERIVETLINRVDRSNIVVAIYGKWGEGKTTLINFISNTLNKKTDFVLINFNPWRFSTEDQLIESFFHLLAESLEEKLDTKKEATGNWIGKNLPFVGSFFARPELVKEIGKLLSNANLEELKDRIQTILLKNERQVIVFMDDIDRLNKDEIHTIFRLIKLTANFDYLTYVLAFDDEVVADSLQERYGTKEKNAGKRFLEKIVQVPIKLPKISYSDLRMYCFSRIDKLINSINYQITDDEITKFHYNYSMAIEAKMVNARVINRYINNLNLIVPTFYKETNFIDLLLIEAIKVVYPEIYKGIRDNPDLFLATDLANMHISQQNKDLVREKLDIVFQEIPESELPSIKKLLTNLFPRLDTVYGNTLYLSHNEKEWDKNRLIASRKYFERYFLYSIPKNEVSDELVDLFLNRLKDNDVSPDNLLNSFINLFNHKNELSFLEKIKIRSGSLDTLESEKLATIMCLSADLFTRNENSGAFPFSTPFSKAAQIVAMLIEKIHDKEFKKEFSKSVINLSSSLMFSREIVFWLDDESEEEKAIFLENIAIKVSEEFAGNFNKLEEYSDDFSKLIHIWSKNKSREEVNQYISELIDHDSSNIRRIISSFTHLKYPMMEVRAPYKSEFERDEHNILKDSFNPKILYDAIMLNFDESVTRVDMENYPYSSEEDDNLLVKQFLWLYNKVENQTEGGEQ